MTAHEIIKNVQERYRGIAIKLAGVTGKCEEWFHSHGREPKTRNPLQSGNLSPVDHFMTYCRQYEACETGAGQMIAESVCAVLTAEFTPGGVTIADVHKEAADVVQSGLDGKPVIDQKRETVEAISVLNGHLRGLSACDVRPFAKAAVAKRRTK